MASLPSTRDSSVTGYVHLVSEINTSSNGKTKFFHFQVQTSQNQAVRLVCFSPEKRLNLHQSQEQRSAVQISPTVKTAKRRLDSFDEYTVQKKSKIAPVQVEFDFNPSFSNRLHTVEEVQDAPVFTTVDIKVKIMTKDEEKHPITIAGMVKFKVDSIIADQTSSIKLAIWEDCIPKVQIGRSYHIQNCKVRVFDDKKFLSTNENTTISEIQEIQNVNLDTSEIRDSVVNATCIGVEINRYSTCVLCNKRLAETQLQSQTVTCSNCKTTSLCELVQRKLICQLALKTVDGKVISYTAFNDSVRFFINIAENGSSVHNIDIDHLTYLFLTAGPQTLIVDKSLKIVAQFLQ